MTIIKPSAPFLHLRFLLLFFGVLLVGGVVYIFEYNSLVNLRHQSNMLQQRIVGAQTANADLKNEMYKMIDPAQLQKLASERALVLDRRPAYLEYAR